MSGQDSAHTFLRLPGNTCLRFDRCGRESATGQKKPADRERAPRSKLTSTRNDQATYRSAAQSKLLNEFGLYSLGRISRLLPPQATATLHVNER